MENRRYLNENAQQLNQPDKMEFLPTLHTWAIPISRVWGLDHMAALAALRSLTLSSSSPFSIFSLLREISIADNAFMSISLAVNNRSVKRKFKTLYSSYPTVLFVLSKSSFSFTFTLAMPPLALPYSIAKSIHYLRKFV